MRTTIDLPEPLFHSLKLMTLQRRMSLKALITQALESLVNPAPPAATRMEKPPIVRGKGLLPKLTNQATAVLLQDADEAKAGLP